MSEVSEEDVAEGQERGGPAVSLGTGGVDRGEAGVVEVIHSGRGHGWVGGHRCRWAQELRASPCLFLLLREPGVKAGAAMEAGEEAVRV